MLCDVVFNHAADADNSLWGMDVVDDKGIYLQDWRTPWGHAAACWKDEVKAFFVDNAEMYFGEYGADGLRLSSRHSWPHSDPGCPKSPEPAKRDAVVR